MPGFRRTTYRRRPVVRRAARPVRALARPRRAMPMLRRGLRRALNPYPTAVVKTFRYQTRYTFTQSISGSQAYFTINANSCNIINVTSGSTHAPYYWDQYAGQYLDASVLSSRVSIKPCSVSTVYAQTAIPRAMFYSIEQVDDPDSTPTVDTILERGGASYTVSTGMMPGRTISKSWSCKTIADTGSNTFQPDASGAAGTYSTERRYYRITAATMDGNAWGTLDTPAGILTVTYRVRLSHRINAAGS